MRVRWQLRKTRDEWESLTEDEREEWLAWDYYQQQAADRWSSALADKKMLHPEAATSIELRKYGL